MSDLSSIDISHPLATGRTAEVFSVGEDRVLKLLKPGFGVDLLERELRNNEAIQAAGGPVPEVFGLVDLGGRTGLVFERVFGERMFDAMLSGQGGLDEFRGSFADLHSEFLSLPRIAGLSDIKDFLASHIDASGLPSYQRRLAKDRLLGLPDGASTLHGDFHPGNILMGANGPVVIDWSQAAQGDPAADIARTLVLLTPQAAADEIAVSTELANAIVRFASAYAAKCMATIGVTAEAVSAWRLPVIAARLSEGITEEAKALQAEVASLTA